MEFRIGDWVVHAAYGLGQLVSIEERKFSEAGARLFYEISLSMGTIWIPVDTEATSGLRPAMTGSELDHYRDVLMSRPMPLNESYRQRQTDLESRLNQNSVQVVCEVVRDLTERERRKALSRTDAVTLKKTQASLYQEWATAAGVSVAEASEEVKSLLLEAQPATVA